MGILDLMFGRTGEGQQGIEGHSYKLPEKSHEFVYPVAVRLEEVEAVADLLEAEAAAPSLADDADELQSAFDDLFDGEGPDATTLVERERGVRDTVETAVDVWRTRLEDTSDDLGVVYVTKAEEAALGSFVSRCRDRSDREDDEFDPPESFPAIAPLLKRMREVTDGQYRVVAHTDLLPDGR
jgi:hypothetical protein